MKKIIAFIVLSLSFCITLQAQDKTIKEALKSYNSENDSILLKYFRSHAEKKQLKELEMDSIPETFRYDEGTVYYAPDDAFKIFVFSGIFSDGFSAFSFHYSVTQFASGHIDENSGFSTIYRITPTAEDSSYIIIDYETIVGSMIQEYNLELHQYKLKKDKLKQQPLVVSDLNLPVSLRNNFSRDKKSFRIAIPLNIPFKDDFITYKANEKTIYYNYICRPGLSVDTEHLKGSFRLDKGKISDFKEQRGKTL